MKIDLGKLLELDHTGKTIYIGTFIFALFWYSSFVLFNQAFIAEHGFTTTFIASFCMAVVHTIVNSFIYAIRADKMPTDGPAADKKKKDVMFLEIAIYSVIIFSLLVLSNYLLHRFGVLCISFVWFSVVVYVSFAFIPLLFYLFINVWKLIKKITSRAKLEEYRQAAQKEIDQMP